MKTSVTILIGIIVLNFYCINAWASWTGPYEIVTGSWGSSLGQFYFGSGDTGDSFPRDIWIDSQSRIFVNDENNARIEVFGNDGSLSKVVVAPQGVNTKLGWPYNIYVHPNGNFVAGYDGPQKFFFDEFGSLIKKIDIYGDAFPTTQGFIFYVQDNKYDFYSTAGQFIKTSTTKPLELGVVSKKALGSGQYKVTVKFPDKEWTIISGGVVPKYTRDLNGNLYGSGDKQAIRWNFCGKELARLSMPVKQITKGESPGEGVEPPITVLEEYGAPVVAPNGDVYTWKRTPDKYSIVKWTWVDDPNTPTGPDAPANLTVVASTTGLYLTWAASPQDPGCVTGYEVSRGAISGGSFSVIATVDKSILNYNDTTAQTGTTYYYKLRAKSGTDFSAYTAAASGTR